MLKLSIDTYSNTRNADITYTHTKRMFQQEISYPYSDNYFTKTEHSNSNLCSEGSNSF